MYGLLTPTTLAAIVADLRTAEANSWIAHPSELKAKHDAEAQLVALVGELAAESLIATFEADYHPTNANRRALCYRHHCEEFDKLPNASKGAASVWVTVPTANCELCTEKETP